MKVKSSSWHYKMQQWAPWNDHGVPKSLCTYFWSLVAITVGSPIVAVLVAVTFPFYWVGKKLYTTSLDKQDVVWEVNKKKIKEIEKKSKLPLSIKIKKFIATYPVASTILTCTAVTAAAATSILLQIDNDGEPLGIIAGCIMITILIGVCVFFVVGMSLSAFSETKLYKTFENRYAIPESEQQLGVILSYLKAKKEKVCPLIEVDYGEPEEDTSASVA